MTIRILRRAGVVAVGTTAAIALAAGSASAHHCYVPMYSLNGPTSSANWIVYTAESAAADPEIADFQAACPEAAEAGYDALRAAGLPVGIKLFGKMTIGDPKGEFRIPNPNGANGKGLEYFGAGSTLAEEMLMTWIEAAASYQC
jgi:hypothetical protein